MKAMCPDISKRYQTADAMLDDLEKFRKDPAVDMDYIREDLKAAVVCQEPTQPLPTNQVAAVSKANSTVAQDEEEKKQSRKVVGLVIGGFALALVLIFVVFKLVAGGFNAGNGTASHQVPDLLGKTLEEAEAMPEIKDIFRIEVVGTKPSDKYEPGQIVEQDPAGGRSRKNNLVIKVYLCAEEDGTLMPNVVGNEFLQAKTELNNLHLDLDVQRADAYSPDVPEGQVMESSPASGEQLKKGDTVVLTVSKGPETKPLTVPSFVTMTIDDAAAQAEAMGLKVGEHQYEYSDKPEGTVIGQSIEQGTEVQSGTEIVFTVSKGSSSAERVVVFDIPDQYHSDSNLKIEVMQDAASSLHLCGWLHHLLHLYLPRQPGIYFHYQAVYQRHRAVSQEITLIKGRIEKALSGFYYVNTGTETLQCRARGRFRREGLSPLVGDWVQVRELGGGEGFVEAIEPRRNAFDRPAAATSTNWSLLPLLLCR